MKRKRTILVIVLLLVLGTGLWFYGYFHRKSNDNIPSRELMVSYYLEKGQEYATDKLLGYPYSQLYEVWGEPDAGLFGMWGDIWDMGDGNALFVYYDGNGAVELVKVRPAGEE